MASVLRMRPSPKNPSLGQHSCFIPHGYELAISRLKKGELSLSWPAISYRPHWCDQYLYCQNANVDSCTHSLSLYMKIFTLDLSMDALENV